MKTSKSYKATCEVSVTEHDVIRTLHDTRPANARSGEARIDHGEMVTLGGVGSLRELPSLLKSCHEWRGPKVRRSNTVVVTGLWITQRALMITESEETK